MPDTTPAAAPNTPAPAAPEYDDFDPVGDESPEQASPSVGSAPPAQEQTSPEPALSKPKHPSLLVELAQEFGMSDEEIAGYSTDQLSLTVNRMQRIAARARAEAPPPEVRAGGPQPVDGSAEEPFDLGLSEDDVDPKIIAAFKKMNERHEKKTARLEAALAVERASKEQSSLNVRVDKAFADLGDPKLFGTGGLEELPANSAYAQRRKAVWNMAKEGASSLPEALARLAQARQVLFGGEPPKQAPSGDTATPQATPSQTTWAAGAVAKPTQRAGAIDPPGPEKAAKTIQAKFAAKGENIPLGSSSLEDELPD